MFGHLIKHSIRAFNQFHKQRKPLKFTPDINDKCFLFIGGLHRSGTSILHRVLREHAVISGFNNTGVMEDEGQHLQSVFEAAHKFGGPGEFAFHLDAHLTESSRLISISNKEALLREWGAYYDLKKQVLLEKSPPNLIRSRFFRKLFPGSRFVFIVRHPIAVALATEKWTDTSMAERLSHWEKAHSIMLEDSRDFDDFLIIRYEDLVNNPQKYLDDICELVGIDKFSPIEKIEDHNTKYFKQWRQLGMSETEVYQSLDKTLLDHFGYRFEKPFVDKK